MERVTNRFKHPFAKEACFVGLVGACTFYYLALVSFNPFDPTGVSASFPPPLEVNNWVGKAGAYTAGFALYLMGATAYLLPIPPVAMFLLFVLGRPFSFAPGRVLGFIILVISLTSLTALYVPEIEMNQLPLLGGGLLGQELSRFFLEHFNYYGCLVLNGTLFLTSISLISRASLGLLIYRMLKKSP